MGQKVNEESLRAVMRHFPQGVAVVVADDGKGPRGVTVSSFVSISLEPPLVLISIAHSSQSHPVIDKASSFAVNILSDEQGALSEHFARPDLSSEEQFRSVPVRKGSLDIPWIVGCLAFLDCLIVDRIEQSDHTLFVARVEHSEIRKKSGRPLVYYSGEYWGLGSVVHTRPRR